MKTEITTHSLRILDKAIQHHYESTEISCPTQEEVENALVELTLEIQRLKEENEMMLKALEKFTKIEGEPPTSTINMISSATEDVKDGVSQGIDGDIV